VNGYTDKLVYAESQLYPNFFASFIAFVNFMCLGACLVSPLLRWILLALGIVPSPGEGPSKEVMDAGFLKMTTVATGASGKKCKSVFYFPTDPGKTSSFLRLYRGFHLRH
jgi:short subunit dehydrogenase-like uncharacterized protein